MSLRIRLSNSGRHGQRQYRIVVDERRSKKDGQSIAILGHYNPSVKPADLQIDQKAYSEWITKGATPTLTIKKLLSDKNN